MPIDFFFYSSIFFGGGGRGRDTVHVLRNGQVFKGGLKHLQAPPLFDEISAAGTWHLTEEYCEIYRTQKHFSLKIRTKM